MKVISKIKNIIFIIILSFFGLYGCSSGETQKEVLDLSTTNVQPIVDSKDLQGLWEGTYNDPFTQYIYINDTSIYYMSSKTIPNPKDFSFEYRMATDYKITINSQGDSICEFYSDINNSDYTCKISKEESILNLLVQGDAIDGKYTLIEPNTESPITTTSDYSSDDIFDSSSDDTSDYSSDTTLGQKNALEAATSYLDYSAFSYSGLIDQLEYEGYTTDEATYAADNCGADWNEQAALCAQSYLDYSSFSRSGLIEQLEYEGFTTTQAEYGAKAVGY
jgi:hypothetical protein